MSRMKFKTKTQIDGDWKITTKTQEGGQVAGWPLCYITVERPDFDHISITHMVAGRSRLRAIKQMKELIELAETLRW